MSLFIGQAINGRDLERFTSGWPAERFASMCDSLAWAASGRQFLRLPSFTARVNASDGGIDAEWDIEIPDDGRNIPTPLLGPGWNVFQYKQRDIMARDRARIIANLKSALNGAIADIHDRSEKAPDRYILFVNIDLLHLHKQAIKETILKGYGQPSDVHVEIAGAAELAALLNDHPHLRAAYFAPLSFKPWQEAERTHRSQKLFGAHVELIGRQAETEKLRSLVQDRQVRIIVVTGPHDIAKPAI